MQVRGIRGAITVDADEERPIVEAATRLLRAVLKENDVAEEDIVSVVFTSTDDLTAAFPAGAVRALGLADVPVLCTRELGVEGAMPKVVRVLVHAYSARSRAEITHVYLEGARGLREDLA